MLFKTNHKIPYCDLGHLLSILGRPWGAVTKGENEVYLYRLKWKKWF